MDAELARVVEELRLQVRERLADLTSRPDRDLLGRQTAAATLARMLVLFDGMVALIAAGQGDVSGGLLRTIYEKDRTFIKGQRYTLLSRWENLSGDGRHSLKKLLAANRRLNAAYLLKEQFGQLSDYQREGWARAFFERWRDSLKWQRLKPREKIAAMIERRWDGIAACKPENRVSLGVVDGLNNQDLRAPETRV